MRSAAPTRSRSSGGSGRPAALDTRGDHGRISKRARARRGDAATAASPSTAAATCRRRRRRGAPRRADSTARPTSRTRRWSRSTAPRASPTARSRSGRRPRCRAWRARSPPRVAGVAEDAVTVHVTYLGGGFGRRLDVDFVGQAVRIALETGGRPVQLVWSREEDLTHDFYRPAGVARCCAPASAPTACRSRCASPAPATRSRRAGSSAALPRLAGPVDTPDKTDERRPVRPALRRRRTSASPTSPRTSGVPVGYWRSVGHSHNAFFSESFIDELAHAAGRDPVDFRLALLKDAPRHAAVLRLAAEKAGWPGQGRSRPLEAARARRRAARELRQHRRRRSSRSSLDNGRPRVHRVVCAADIGTVVNPGIVAQQMESAVIFALSARRCYGRIDIVGGVVQQTNFPNYPVVRLADAPLIETHLCRQRRSRPGGVGEIGTPPLAPALANALFALTGRRLRELPLAAAA